MINHKKIIVVLPAYNAEKTLKQTVKDIPHEFIDEILLVDDRSQDHTIEFAKELGLTTFQHEKNLGYGGNQKTCYQEALKRGADVIIMLHPDYQYDPRLLLAMAAPICYGVYDVMLGSRIIGGQALKGGMPVYKYIANRALTFIQNLVLRNKLSEYHTGYRAFDRKVLEQIPFRENSNNFVFDAEILAQITAHRFSIGEVSCPTKYFREASSIRLFSSIRYGFGCLRVCINYLQNKYSPQKSLNHQ